MNITYKTLKDKLNSFRRTTRGDPVKLVSVCYVLTVLLARDNKTRINLEHVKWADEFEKFKLYQWGLESYNTMVENLKSIMKGQPMRFRNTKATSAKFTLYGCPHILQVWAYENVPNLGEQCVERVGSEEVPMLNWKAKGFFHARKLNELVFKDNDDEEEVDDDDDECENDIEDEVVWGKGYKAKVMDEIQVLREHVAALESRLKLMEDMFNAEGVVPEKAAEVAPEHVTLDMEVDAHDKAVEVGLENKIMEMELNDHEVEDKDQVEQDVEDEPTYAEEVAEEPTGEMADANHMPRTVMLLELRSRSYHPLFLK
ncbi:unnamed protein product [Cuscuta epithymum]|uniref:DUF1985 domain-containing protein n=1 Tax=Cuscuta epithymum TaxID=186058 RepID=A0AAV0FM21_9ASTE|nr:unnamed protein product [Cuscuta epithymum]CAH9136581.1 unnamed protein product [Cuscuta epithymum]